MRERMMIFSGRSNPQLAEEICSHLGMSLSKASFTTFSNENIKVKIEENVREADVFVVQTSCPPVHDHLMELLIMIDALKYASAARITAVLPYYPYVLSDKKDEPRISITARLVADLLATAGANRILTMNLHSAQIMGFSRVPIDQLTGIPTICDYFERKGISDFVAAAPDIGRAKVTEKYSQRLGLRMVVLDKRRRADDEKAYIEHIIGDVDGHDVVFFDDEVKTGGSLLIGAEALKEQGAKRILIGCVHGVLTGDAAQKIQDSEIEELVITNTLPLSPEKRTPKITQLSVAPLFGEAIKAIHRGESVSRLFSKQAVL